MAKRELRKMKRADLLEILSEQARENEALKADLKLARQELSQRVSAQPTELQAFSIEPESGDEGLNSACVQAEADCLVLDARNTACQIVAVANETSAQILIKAERDAAEVLAKASEEAKRTVDEARGDAMLMRLGATKEAEIIRDRERAACEALWEETRRTCFGLLDEAQTEIDRLFAEAMEACSVGSGSFADRFQGTGRPQR